MRLFLISNDLDIFASQDDKYKFVIGIASGETKYDQILDWLKAHTQGKSGAQQTGGFCVSGPDEYIFSFTNSIQL